MLTRDEFIKLRAKYIVKANNRAARLMAQGKAMEAAQVQVYNVIFEGLMNYMYLQTEKDYNKVRTSRSCHC